MIRYRVETFKGRGKQPWFFRLIRGSRIHMVSEGYKYRRTCRRYAKDLHFAIQNSGYCVYKELDNGK